MGDLKSCYEAIAQLKVITRHGKVGGGEDSRSGFTGDLELRQLLDVAQLVLNYVPVFSTGHFMWMQTLPLLCTALSAV